MGIGESHSLRCQLVEVGSFDFSALGIEALHVAVSEVVREDVNDVSFGRRWACESAEAGQRGDCCNGGNGSCHGFYDERIGSRPVNKACLGDLIRRLGAILTRFDRIWLGDGAF